MSAHAQFDRPTGIYAIGLSGQAPQAGVLEKPFVDGVQLAQEWRNLEGAEGMIHKALAALGESGPTPPQK